VRAGLDAASLHQSWTREWHWLLVRFYLVPHDAGRYAALQTGPLSGRSRSRSPTTTPPPQDFESLEILEQPCCRTIKAERARGRLKRTTAGLLKGQFSDGQVNPFSA